MAFKFKMPDIGEGLQEGEIVKWLVSEGDQVEEDQPIVEVMTDKATVELPSPRTGTIKKILHDEGSVVPVGEVFVEIEEGEGGESEAEADEKAEKKSEKKDEKAEEAEEEGGKKEEKEEKMLFESSSSSAGGTVTRRKARTEKQEEAGGPNGARSGKVLATPATRKLAREMDVDLTQVEGSGPKGRVTKDDVKAFAEGGRKERKPAAPSGGPAVQVLEQDERVPLKGMRRVIAEAMARSKRTAAHFTYVDELQVDDLVAWRKRAKKAAEERGMNMTYLPFLVKAAVAALKQYPMVNSHVDDENNEIVMKGGYHIGIAVATDAGLVVPVVRDADKKSMWQIQEEIQDLAERTRQGKAKPDELRGSTFTITSLGKTGGLLATPVLNYPEVAIMGVHEIMDKPVIREIDGQKAVVPGKVMNLSYSFDHRIIDGAVGADFAKALGRYVRDPDLLLLEG